MRANTIPVSDGGAPERAIAVAGVLPGEEAGVEDSLKELKELLRTASAEVVGEVVQRIPHRGQPAYLGKGKLEELAALAAALRADFVAFDDDLKPSQARNIEKVVKVRVLDRTEVILSIFAMHARTNEAKAQVELAQLEYSAPRLRHRWSHLWRQTAGYAIGTRGPGEKQLEVDRRALRKRMTDLKRELAEIRAHRNRIVSSRPAGFTVSLVGYTNSGKSTTLNALTGADAPAEDKLFSTLDTRTRTLTLENGLKVLVSDTVGFIRKLPAHLVASFHATLEETRRARLLLHVVDASHPAHERQMEAVREVLAEIGCGDGRVLAVFNKMDVVSDFEAAQLRERHPDACFISALTGEGMDELRRRIRELLLEEAVEMTVRIPFSRGRLLAEVLDSGFTVGVRYGSEHAEADLVIPEEELGKILKRGAAEVESVE